MKKKICFRCNIEKEVSEYYKHKAMADGHLNKCKECSKSDSRKRHDELLKDSKWVELELKRHREKYHRLMYKEKHKQGKDINRKSNANYKNKYPEKVNARNKSSHLRPIIKGNHLHHWSYNNIHCKDVIELSLKEHYKAHRFIIYDQERMMYRRFDTLELLDTKELHFEFINNCIKNKPD